MKVVCTALTEFLESLQAAGGLFDNTVRVNVSRTPLDKDGAKFQVVFCVSAVVEVGDEIGSQYLIEFGQKCGIDYEDADRQLDGTQAAQSMRDQVGEVAKQRGWRVLPGVLSI